MEEKKRVDERRRNFATVVYPESAVDGWQEILADACVPSFISPLHDKDINQTGHGDEPKKAHYHVMLMFEGKKSKQQVLELVKTFGGVGIEPINSMRGYARYLCHLDNPEKAQYQPDQVRSLGGADYQATIGLPTDKYKAVREMMEWCKEYNVYSYSDLLDYASEERFDWFRVLCDSATVVIKEYLKSRDWTRRNRGDVRED